MGEIEQNASKVLLTSLPYSDCVCQHTTPPTLTKEVLQLAS